jgi:phosphomevalonate kinase
MTERLVARAPGKLLLLGEYAVLDGCPAIVAAVGGHVEVQVESVPHRGVVEVDAPGICTAEFSPATPPVAVGPLRFVIAAFRAAVRRAPTLSQHGLRICVANRLTGRDTEKIGLGSSAAVTAAMVAALLASARGWRATDVDREEVLAVGIEAHRAAQGSVGSGADVAASVYGGLVRFQLRNGSPPGVTRLELPSTGTLAAAWSGEAAATEGLVKTYLAAGNGHAAVRTAFVDASRACVDRFVSALERGEVSLAAVNANGDILERLGDALGLPLLTPRLRQLVQIARRHDAAAKISGAGNGDCGIALTADPAAAQRVRTAWAAAGLTPLDVQISHHGVTVGRC